VDEADNGRDAHFQGDSEAYDAVVLDLGLPLLDGLSVLKRWRDAGPTMPVLILTARDNWNEKVAGIDAGADDYLTKPFHMEELLARVRGLIRRAAGQASPVLRCGELALDTRSGRVTLGGQAVTLTSHEFKVLDYLMHRPGQRWSRAWS
jgi:two-component system OmpR family response regulator